MKKLCWLLLLVLFASTLSAQEFLSIERLSQNSSATGGDGAIGVPALSPNGKFATFASTSTNLVSSDTNNQADIFVRNLKTGALARTNFGPLSGQANDDSSKPDLSAVTAKGFFALAYQSQATNLSALGNLFPDTNGNTDIFLSFPTFGNLTERISVGPGPVEANGDCEEPSVTVVPEPNRALVTYSSTASNLVSGDTNNRRDIFLATVSGIKSDGFNPNTDIVTVRVSKAAVVGQQSDGLSEAPQISTDGRFIVFESTASNLVSGITPTTRQVYLYDVAKGTTSLVSKAADGTPGNGSSKTASISYSGGFVVYLSNSSNIINDGFDPGSTTLQVIRFNTATGESSRANQNELGIPGNGIGAVNINAFVSPDGRFVIFSDRADNLVANDTNGAVDIFVKDFATGKLALLSRNVNGEQGNDASRFPTSGGTSFASTTGLVLFQSEASNLVSSDSEGNADIFSTTFSIPTLPLRKNTKLELPAEVNVTGDDAAVSLQRFDGTSLKSGAQIKGQKTSAATLRNRVVYLIEARREGFKGAKQDLRRKLSKRNEITFKNLKSGTYLVRYKAQIQRGTKILSKTKFSPTQRISREE